MPTTISFLSPQTPANAMFQVVDLTNLYPGIDHYYRGYVKSDVSLSKPLNIVHYTVHR